MKRIDYTWQLAAEDCHYDSFVRIGYRFQLFDKNGARRLIYRIADGYFAITARPRRNKARVRFTSSKTYRKIR